VYWRGVRVVDPVRVSAGDRDVPGPAPAPDGDRLGDGHGGAGTVRAAAVPRGGLGGGL